MVTVDDHGHVMDPMEVRMTLVEDMYHLAVLQSTLVINGLDTILCLLIQEVGVFLTQQDQQH